MLDNTKVFDVVTPMSYFHNVSRKIKNVEEFDIKRGMWCKQVAGGVMSFNESTTAATSGVNVLCLSDAKKPGTGASMYETNDVKVGSVTAINTPGVRVTVGEDFLVAPAAWDYSVYNAGVSLGVEETAGADAGKLKAVTTGDWANAMIEDVDNVNKTVTYFIAATQL